MKMVWQLGASVVCALALGACGGGDSGNSAAANGAAASNAAAPAAEEGNESESAAAGESAAPEAATPAGAQQDFTIVNNTGQTVLTLNVSPSDENSWGPDILGAAVLPNGQQGQVRFARGQDQCSWDIRATFENGGTGDWRNVDLCETATVTLTGE